MESLLFPAGLHRAHSWPVPTLCSCTGSGRAPCSVPPGIHGTLRFVGLRGTRRNQQQHLGEGWNSEQSTFSPFTHTVGLNSLIKTLSPEVRHGGIKLCAQSLSKASPCSAALIFTSVPPPSYILGMSQVTPSLSPLWV